MKHIPILVPVLLGALALQMAGAATITVTSTADSGPGSMRAALASVSDGDTIDVSGVSGTILLTNGELTVTNSVTILGPGPANLAVDGNHADRVFHIGSNTVVSISSLTITNGITTGTDFPADSGGGIYNDQATLTVSNCAFNRNSAREGGGGIYSYHGMLTVSGCTLSANSASLGGGIGNNGESGFATLTIVNSTISGGAFLPAGIGGGIYNDGRYGVAILTVSNCTIRGNLASGYGGGIGNDAESGSATVTIANSTLNANTAFGSGGGIWNNGQFGSATLMIANSTLSSNTYYAFIARNDLGGGGIYNFADVGSARVWIVNSTLSGNSSDQGGGIYNQATGQYGVGNATVEIGSTILNAGASGGNIFNVSGIVTSDGYNLSSDDASGLLSQPADLLNTDPLLGPLQDNGGPTFTHAPLPGSPAIDQGRNFSGSATDQRGVGFARTSDAPAVPNAPGGDATDIGAFEVQQQVSPSEQINDLIALVRSFNLMAGTANSLVVKLQAAASALGRGRADAACGLLGAFANEVNAQTGKKLTTAQAALLIANVTRIRTALNCP